jgi:hypothetical protein
MSGWASFGVSAVALLVSLVVLRKSYLAPATIKVVPGVLRLRLYPYSNADRDWQMPAFSLTVSLTNEGARTGVVDGMRLRVTYSGVDPPDNYETFDALVHLERPLGLRVDTREQRDLWLESSPEWSPVAVLAKETVTQHLIFQAGPWMTPVHRPVRVILQVHIDRGSVWRTIETWTVALDAQAWSFLGQGSPWPGYSDSRVDSGQPVYPEDLPARRARSST